MRLSIVDRALGVELRRAVPLAVELGLDGIQIFTVGGESDPSALGLTARRELREYIARYGLVLSATCIDEGPFNDPATVDERVSRAQSQIDLAVALGTNAVTGHVGAIPSDAGSSEYALMRDALREVCRYAEHFGVRFGMETGLESPECLHKFVDDAGYPGMGVNYDPANLMLNGFDWLGGVCELGDVIVHCHAKDAYNPERDDRRGEAPLGRGDIDFEAFFTALLKAGFDGFAAIERERPGEPMEEITYGVQRLREISSSIRLEY